MKLLIADDQQSVHRYMESTIPLADMGFTEVFHAYDGQECLRLLGDEAPQVLVLDIRMPLLDGMDVLAAIQEKKLAMPRTVILSAYGEFQYAQAAIRYGVTNYLLKPIDRGELKQALASCMQAIYGEFAASLQDYLTSESRSFTMGERFPLWRTAVRGVLLCGEPAQDGPASLAALSPWQLRLHDARVFCLLPAETEPTLPDGAGVKGYCSLPHALRGAEALSDCYEECLAAEQLTTFYGKGAPLAHYVCAPSLWTEDISALAVAAQDGAERGAQVLSQLFEEIARVGPQPRQVTEFFVRLLVAVLRKSKPAPASMMDLIAEEDLTQSIQQCETLTDLRETVFNALRFLQSAGEDAAQGDDRFSRDVLRFMEENLSQPLSLDQLAQQFLINKYDLCHRFKLETGESLWSCLTRLRVDAAKTLLAQTKMKSYEIAEATGFRSVTYFSNVFKKVTGVRPQQWKAASVTPSDPTAQCP